MMRQAAVKQETSNLGKVKNSLQEFDSERVGWR